MMCDWIYDFDIVSLVIVLLLFVVVVWKWGIDGWFGWVVLIVFVGVLLMLCYIFGGDYVDY